jgi:hypothetical protein
MKRELFYILVLFQSSLALADDIGESPKPIGPESCNGPGRYQLVQNPQFRADQFVLDTCLGRVWQLVTYTDIDKKVWQSIPRVDSEQELVLWQLQETIKSKGDSESN